MKKLNLYLALFGTLLFFFGCNDEWKNEQYSQMVSLKAPINDDVTFIYLRYTDDGEVTYKLPVIVSGSQMNNKDYSVRIGTDNDTLGLLNTQIYGHREDLYFHQLPEQFYEFPKESCFIPSGSSKELFEVNFKFAGLDLVEKWVLPLTILADDSYTMNTYKGRQKALLNVRPFNDYSGSYGATSMNVYFGTNTSSYMMATSRTAQVVDENTIFFYAGITEELSDQRGEYKVKCKFLEPISVDSIYDSKTGENTGLLLTKGELEVSSDISDLNLHVEGTPTYTITEEFDIDRPFILKRTYTLTMTYTYEDTTSSETAAFPYRCVGTMTMQRNINTLVPFEDQAILW